MTTASDYLLSHMDAVAFLAEHPRFVGRGGEEITREKVAKVLGERAALAWDDMQASRLAFRKAVTIAKSAVSDAT